MGDGADHGFGQLRRAVSTKKVPFGTSLVGVDGFEPPTLCKNLKTTMNYLDSFEDETKAKQVENLLPFRKKLEEVEGVKG